MTLENKTVGPLMKVTLMLRATLPQPSAAIHIAPMSFIYGIGAEGLTPFEKALAGKSPGQHLCLQIASTEQFADIFGHLGHSVTKIIDLPPPWQLEATVDSLVKADSRELIKAMAELSGCGGGCGCGCS